MTQEWRTSVTGDFIFCDVLDYRLIKLALVYVHNARWMLRFPIDGSDTEYPNKEVAMKAAEALTTTSTSPLLAGSSSDL